MAFCGFLELSNFLFNHSGNTVHLRMGQGGLGLNRDFVSCNAECKILQLGLENRTPNMMVDGIQIVVPTIQNMNVS